ncbi:hypothetical protein PROFUN_12585 [Planoprotostelium fungivorum]|uniref:AP complex subunit beta n=1 Tax=Planoprotostelium fungivorum TaxID=1890364 RepID=A0A2P6N6X4_9EUKA|nr:hypothetical protein PROFUN_12585 [Planoprotostelium fungivorum]
MSDAKYFGGGSKKGEISELQEELHHQREDKRKEAVKKVIAAMTVGKDVSMLFTDVLNCIQTNNLELKKLVYLYVINHAKLQPEKAILAVNTFQKDASDLNPLVRALAIRTMGCIRVDRVTEYLCEPLRNCLKDKDPYVRKTAALCVAKLYDLSAELVETQGFLELLIQLLSDSNPTVVANAVAALTEIEDISGRTILQLTASNLNKLLAALNECTEWGQVFILNSLSKFSTADSKDAESICERVAPRLNHANSAVVLAAVKVIMSYMDHIENPEAQKGLCKKMGPPLVTLLTTKEPEIQYVALRNINLIVQKKPSILAHEMRVFFIKYNDPIYVKMEKLEIMIMLAAERNIEQVLNEFKEAASEVDVEFVRKAVRAIGRCAIKIDKAADRCVAVLLELIQMKVSYVVQESIIVIKDIFRKYPNQYESIIATLCQNLDTLDEPEAKASMIWIVGEYAERIENADALLDSFLDNFHDESSQVQLQLVTAVVKLFLKRPKDTQDMVQKVLNMATQETDNPDLRDRGYIYWRLLSTDPEAAKNVVLGEKPLISESTIQIDEAMLSLLCREISSLASVYHKLPDTFVTKLKEVRKDKVKKDRETDGESLLPQEQQGGGQPNIFDLDSVGESLPQTSAPAARAPVNVMDELDFLSSPSTGVSQPVSKEIVLPAERGNGMQVAAGAARRGGQLHLDLTIQNQAGAPLGDFAIQFNKNPFGFAPTQLQVPPVNPMSTVETSLAISNHPNMFGPAQQAANIIQIALKNNSGVFYFQVTIPFHLIFSEAGEVSRDDYLSQWRSMPDEHVREVQVAGDSNSVQGKLRGANLFYVAKRTVAPQEFVYFSAKVGEALMMVEVSFGGGPSRINTKSRSAELIPAFEQALYTLLR